MERHESATAGGDHRIGPLTLLPFKMVNGITNGMQLKIDRAGRIVVPKPIRQRLGLQPNTEIEIVEQVERKPAMVKRNGRRVHTGKIDPNFDFNKLIDDVREERIRDLLKI
jgi:AbrB family looped-hinge helix DNA binding protein